MNARSKNHDFSAPENMTPPFEADHYDSADMEEMDAENPTDEDAMESDALVHDEAADYDVYVVEEAAREYVGRWNRLISKTNWEKGLLISEWRAGMILSSAPAQLYSDDAWSRRVGNVSPQHVGRLRRVYERFSEAYENYPGLYWSHFQAALDWNDAEVWLEGAVHQRWSVTQMRKQRWVAIGAPPECKPRDEDVILAELDEDVTGALDSPNLSGLDGTADLSAVMPKYGEDGKIVADGVITGAARGESPRDGKESGASADGLSEFSDPGKHGDSGTVVTPKDAPIHPADMEAQMQDAISRPFEDLPPLPEDVEEAFEAMKIAILNHKLAKWTRVSRTEMLKVLDSLKALCE